MPESGLVTFRGTEWGVCYRHEDGDLTELFYNPALASAVCYDRMTGYFSAGALAVAARGIAALVENNGKMRLLVGCKPNPPESDAIDKGYDLRAKIEQKLVETDLTPPDEPARQALEMLAWMVAHGYLDVKVAVPVDSRGRPEHTTGIYHEKVGILTDAEGDRLTFSGSINETWNGWMENRETFHVFCSWLGERELAHVQKDEEAFTKFWEDRAKSVRVFDFPDAAKNKLLEFLPKNDRFLVPPKSPAEPEFRLLPDERTRIVWTFMSHAARLSTGERVGEKTSAVVPWPHQIRTAHSYLESWPSRLLIADEVGLGKTISAGLIIRQAVLSGCAKRILLLTPKAVQIQWQNELYEKFNLNVPIYDGATLNWRRVWCRRAI